MSVFAAGSLHCMSVSHRRESSLYVCVLSQGAFMGRVVFDDIPPLCGKTSIVINEVFSRPEMVMCKFVLNLYHGKLQVSYSYSI